MDLSLCSSEICLKWTTRHLVHLVVSSNSVGAIYAAGGCDEGLPRMPCVESFCSAKKCTCRNCARCESCQVPSFYCFQGCKVGHTIHAISCLFGDPGGRPFSCGPRSDHCLMRGACDWCTLAEGSKLGIESWESSNQRMCGFTNIVTLSFFIILIVNLFLLLSWFLWLLLLIQSLFL